MPTLPANRFAEMNARAREHGIFVYTHFLDLNEQSILTSLQLSPVLFGGAVGCERRIARFGDENEIGYHSDFPILCIRISPASAKYAETLTHRDCLGALMSLGFERELIGDIILRDNHIYLFCEDHIAAYICDHLAQVRNTRVICEITDMVPEGDLFKTKTVRIQIVSERLDAVIAHVWHLSRSEAQILFQQNKVFVNSRCCTDRNYTPEPGQIISVRSFGRFRYDGISGKSAKGKLNADISLYL